MLIECALIECALIECVLIECMLIDVYLMRDNKYLHFIGVILLIVNSWKIVMFIFSLPERILHCKDFIRIFYEFTYNSLGSIKGHTSLMKKEARSFYDARHGISYNHYHDDRPLVVAIIIITDVHTLASW